MIIKTQGSEGERTKQIGSVDKILDKNIQITKNLLLQRGFLTPAFLFITDKRYGMQLFDIKLASAMKCSPLDQCLSFLNAQLEQCGEGDQLQAYQCVSEAWQKEMKNMKSGIEKGLRYGDIEKMANRTEVLQCTTVRKNNTPVLDTWKIIRSREGDETSKVINLKKQPRIGGKSKVSPWGSGEFTVASPKTPMFNESGIL